MQPWTRSHGGGLPPRRSVIDRPGRPVIASRSERPSCRKAPPASSPTGDKERA